MAKAKAKAEKLVERIVVGPKGIHAIHHKTGERFKAEIGDTVWLSARTAKTFSRYLKDPKVAAAEAAVAEAEADAEAEGEAPESPPNAEPSESEGGGSDES